MKTFDLVAGLKSLTGEVRRQLSSLGGARSVELTATAKVLRRKVAETLSVAGGGIPAAPGEPPHAQSKRLARSVKAGVVGDAQWIGPIAFYGGFQEEGVNAVAGTRKVRSGRGRRSRSGSVQRTVRILPHPYLLRSLEAAKGEMGEEFAGKAAITLGAK